MLSALPYSRVRMFLMDLLPINADQADAIRRIDITADGIDLLFTHTDDWVQAFEHDYDDPENHARFLSLIKILWGGTLDNLMRIEVFNGGYTVETRTSVYDDHVPTREVRVGALLV